MERRRFGLTKFHVPVIGQGTWQMEDDDRASAITALRLGLDLGMTHVDTAEMYGSGFVETLVGEAIAGRRAEVFLVSKVIPAHASRTGTLAACEASLVRLGTEWLDCYLLHWPGRHPLEDTIAAFEQLIREGKILSWGVSNFDVPDLDEVQVIAGDGHLACNQVLYHLRERAVEHRVLPWCERHGVALSPIARSARGIFPGPARGAACCSRRSPPLTGRPRARSPLGSSCSGSRSSRSPRRRPPSTPPRTREPGTCVSPRPRWT